MKIYTGSYTGNGSDNRDITGVGFQADFVMIFGRATTTNWARFKDQTGDNSSPIGHNFAQISNLIQSISSDGFQLGTGSEVNGNGTVYDFIAIKANSVANFKSGSYAGTGVDGLTVSGLGFRPTLVLVKSRTTTDRAVWRPAALTGDNTLHFVDIATFAGGIKSLDNDGFTLGTNATVNTGAVTYDYIALKYSPVLFRQGSYTGDGADNRDITGLGFNPDFVAAKANGATVHHAFGRFSAFGSDGAKPFSGFAGYASDRIQANSADGFQVGANNDVNQNTYLCHYFAFKTGDDTVPAITADYSQPALPERNRGWAINSLDIQVVTKSEAWNQSQSRRLIEYQAIKNLGITYAAIAVPYDNPTKYAAYVADARTKGLKVYHRAHWNGWEGDNSIAAGLSRQNYLDDSYNYILSHPTFYENGDMFGMSVEPSNANDKGNYTYRTPETSGGTFDITKYNQFLKDQVKYANAAFAAIGKSVYTFPVSPTLSLLNLAGQTLDSGEVGRNDGLGDADFVQYFGGILTLDHYLSDAYRATSGYGAKLSSDLDKIHAAFPNCRIMIGEWGYHTTTSVSDQEHYDVFREVCNVFASKDYIIGVNVWVHMASTTASIFTDSGGTINSNGRLSTQAIKAAFRGSNATFGRPKSSVRPARH